MALTTHPRSTPDTDSAPETTPSRRTPSTRGLASWALAITGAVAAAALAVTVFQSGADAPSPASPQLLIEQGSIRAVERADALAAVEGPPVAAHRQLVESGSIRAVDRTAAATAPAGGGSGNHSLLIENGSIRAIEHADDVPGG